ncbi:MAG: type II secretion system F family protein [Planctomycetota bacterium]
MPSALAMAYDNLSSMLGAGVPVLRSLKTVSPGLKRRTKRAFLGVAEGVAKGNTLTETMKLHPRVFSRVDVMLVEVGEKSGNLPDMIGLLSKWHEMANRMVRKILAGLLFGWLAYGCLFSQCGENPSHVSGTGGDSLSYHCQGP